MWRSTHLKVKYLGWGAILLILLAIIMPSIAAQGASSIAQGFQSDEDNIPPGAIVSLKADSPNTVELSSIEHVNQLLGVVGEAALIELSDDSTAVQVITSGVASALLTDLNGEIKSGDKITASPIEGVGMKATESAMVVGTAQADLESVDTKEQTITDREGKTKTVQIGLVPIQVDTIFFTGSSGVATYVPDVLQNLANSVAGSNVSPLRVVVATLLILLLIISIVVLLYSAVKSSIISIGRNPLSEGAVQKSLLQVGLTVVGLLAFTVILVYLILTL